MAQSSAISGRADTAISGSEEGEKDCGAFVILPMSEISSYNNCQKSVIYLCGMSYYYLSLRCKLQGYPYVLCFFWIYVTMPHDEWTT